MTTLSTKRRPTDRYRIELNGFKRVEFYASTVLTPDGEKEPEKGDLVHPNVFIETEKTPETFLGKPINETTIKFIALYHKLDPIPRRRNLIITTQRKNLDLTDELIGTLDELIPGKYRLRKHRGKNAVFINDGKIIEEILAALGDRYTKKYPAWIAGSPYEKLFVEERIKNVLIPRKNSVEITSSSVNNPVLMKMLLNQGYYLNVRKIEHKSAKNRELWYITLYPTKDSHVEFIYSETGMKPKKRRKNVINGLQYHRTKTVTPLQQDSQ